MGRYVFKLPDVGEGTAEAELVAWHVKVGDAVEEDQVIADVMTDKATVELTSPVAGKVTAAHGQLLAGFAVGGGDLAGDRAGQLHRRLVGHDVGEDLVLGDMIADLDVPGDQFGLGGAFTDVGQFEDVATHLNGLRS